MGQNPRRRSRRIVIACSAQSSAKGEPPRSGSCRPGMLSRHARPASRGSFLLLTTGLQRSTSSSLGAAAEVESCMGRAPLWLPPSACGCDFTGCPSLPPPRQHINKALPHRHHSRPGEILARAPHLVWEPRASRRPPLSHSLRQCPRGWPLLPERRGPYS